MSDGMSGEDVTQEVSSVLPSSSSSFLSSSSPSTLPSLPNVEVKMEVEESSNGRIEETPAICETPSALKVEVSEVLSTEPSIALEGSVVKNATDPLSQQDSTPMPEVESSIKPTVTDVAVESSIAGAPTESTVPVAPSVPVAHSESTAAAVTEAPSAPTDSFPASNPQPRARPAPTPAPTPVVPPEECPPSVVYQTADFEVYMAADTLRCSTTLWLAYPSPVHAGTVISLHSRSSSIESITVNGIPAQFSRKDGLSNLAFIPKKRVLNGADMDVLYRGALEIARDGELRIIVPDLNPPTGSTAEETRKKSSQQDPLEPPKPIPRDSPPDVIQAYEGLVALHRHMSSRIERDKNTARYELNDESFNDKESATTSVGSQLLQVKIRYSVSGDCGIIFRKPPKFASLFHRLAGGEPLNVPKGSVCAYSTSFTTGELRNVDGVRCWLPCIDSLDQRCVFDISFTLSKPYFVTSCGKRLSVVRSANHSGALTKRTYRFFSSARIPAAQVGFFIGKVEAYLQDFDRMHARVAVATGLADFVAIPESEVNARAAASGLNNTKKTKSNMPGDAPVNTENNSQTGDAPPVKRPRTHSAGDATSLLAGTNTTPAPPASISVRRLYSDAVHHTMLGFDLALRLIHSFCGHRNEHEEITIIFVADLGRPFMAFDAFFLVDAKFLHTADQLHMESTAHFQLIEAYLSSWLRSAMPIASYDSEFIILGFIHYLVRFYMEEVLGDEEAQWLFQQMYETVLSLEQRGRGYAIANGLAPERYDNFTMSFGVYLQAKSAVVFHMLATKLGSRDSMRLVLRELIKSPLVFSSNRPHRNVPNLNEAQQPTAVAVASPLSAGSYSVDPYGSSMSPMGPISPYAAYGSGGVSPHRIGSVNNSGGVTPQLGYQSPFPYYQPGSLSPYRTLVGAKNGSSPLFGGGNVTGGYQGSEWATMGGHLSPGSITSAMSYDSSMSPDPHADGGLHASRSRLYGWGTDFNVFSVPCLTAEAFILVIRHRSEASADLDEVFLGRYIYQPGIGLFRVNINVTPRVEGKARTIMISSDQLPYSRTRLLPRERTRLVQELPLILVEERDNNITKPFINFTKKKELYKQQAYTRPGRRGGRPRKDLTSMQHLSIEEIQRIQSERPARQIAKDAEFPVKYALFDPMFECLADVQLTSCDAVLIEQLFTDYAELGGEYEPFKVYYQCQALKSLARSLPMSSIGGGSLGGSSSSVGDGKSTGGISGSGSTVTPAVGTSAPGGTSATGTNTGAGGGASAIISAKIPEKYDRLQVKAMSDCILGVTYNAAPSPPASIFVRASAAFALARWQNNNAPMNVSVDSETSNEWIGLTALLECFYDLYMDKDHRCLAPVNLADEHNVYLRNSLILALSTIRCLKGFTPWEVSETLVMVAEHLEELSLDNEGGDLFLSPIDDAPFRAVVFLALSRIRFAHIDCTDSEHAIHRITRIARTAITDAFTQARALARIQFRPRDANQLPALSSHGMHVAAAITCLSEMDCQVALALASGRAKGDRQLRFLDRHTLNVLSLFTRMEYHHYFLPPNVPVRCCEGTEESRYGAEGGASPVEELDFLLCTPVVRAAAFEAFVRLAFTMHCAHEERQRNKRQAHEARLRVDSNYAAHERAHPRENSASSADPYFVSAAVEVMQYVLEHDLSIWVKQNTAQIFLDALHGHTPRIAFEFLSFGQPLNCNGWSDPLALTLPTNPMEAKFKRTKQGQTTITTAVFTSSARPDAFKVQNEFIRVATIYLNRAITKLTSQNQTIRATLLQAWIEIFGPTTPALWHGQNNVYAPICCQLYNRRDFATVGFDSGFSKRVDVSNSDDDYGQGERLKLPSATEIYHLLDEAIRYGPEVISSLPKDEKNRRGDYSTR